MLLRMRFWDSTSSLMPMVSCEMSDVGRRGLLRYLSEVGRFGGKFLQLSVIVSLQGLGVRVLPVAKWGIKRNCRGPAKEIPHSSGVHEMVLAGSRRSRVGCCKFYLPFPGVYDRILDVIGNQKIIGRQLAPSASRNWLYSLSTIIPSILVMFPTRNVSRACSQSPIRSYLHRSYYLFRGNFQPPPRPWTMPPGLLHERDF